MKRILFFVAIPLVMLSSCNKDEFAKILVQIEGVITNAKTGESISNANVKIMTNGGEVTTTSNENGYFNLGDFPIGDYVAIVEKDSFLTGSFDVESYGILRLEGNSKQVVNIDIELMPLSETKTLTIYKLYNGSSNALAAANISYTLYLGQFSEPITGTTDANGLITLNNLPYYSGSSSGVYLSFDFTKDGIRYKQDFSHSYIMNYKSLTVYGYIENGDLGLVSTNVVDSKGIGVEDFNVNDNIFIGFTQPIDTSSHGIYINGYYGVVNVTWSNNNMRATVTPLTSLTSNYSYGLSISVSNELNTDSFYKTINFKTE